MRRDLLLILFALVALLSGVPAAQASPIVIPPGLAPGSTYFLVFVTAGTRDATSSNIGDYDAFVTSQANLDPTLAALGTTWLAIGSTATVDAVTHIGVTGPVYNLQGQLVATGSADMFDFSLSGPIGHDQFGTANNSGAWTGSDASGFRLPGFELGSIQGLTEFGVGNSVSASWIEFRFASNAAVTSIYGISGPLVVPAAAVPEPASLLLLGSGLVLVGARLVSKRRL